MTKLKIIGKDEPPTPRQILEYEIVDKVAQMDTPSLRQYLFAISAFLDRQDVISDIRKVR